MKVLVTGGTGLVGSHLCERLVKRGDAVTALIRNPQKARRLSQMGVQLAPGDLIDPASIANNMEDFDVVYHCAAAHSLPHQGDRQQMMTTNVEGTRHLLECAANSGVKRFLHVSSVSVYAGSSETEITEDTSLQASGHYSESKILSESIVREYEKNSNLEVVIIRPCVIYGPGDQTYLPMFLETFGGGIFPLVSGGNQLLDMVYVTDVAGAIVLGGTTPEAAGKVYNVTDGTSHTFREITEILNRYLDEPFHTISIPYPIAYGFSAISYLWTRFTKPSEDPLVSPAGIKSMAKSRHYSMEKIQHELGFEPKVSLEEGLKEAVDWYIRMKEGSMGNGKHREGSDGRLFEM